MPNANDRLPVMRTDLPIGQADDGALPNIYGTFYIDVYGGSAPTGAFSRDSNYNVPNHQNWAAEGWRMILDASTYSSVYKNGITKAIPASFSTMYIIRY